MPAPEFHRSALEKGFTLTGLIMVILTIVSTISVRFIGFAAQGPLRPQSVSRWGLPVA